MLQLEGVHAGYGPVEVLRDVAFETRVGEITCLMGRNGAGKSTLLKCVMGLVPATSGRILLDGAEIQGLPAHRIPGRGVGWVPQGRRLFGAMTVAENLDVGLLVRDGDPALRERALALFPRLRERLDQTAATLSGGEQQMLAIARALCLDPRVLLLDEPTEGLQPGMIALIRDVLTGLRAEGVAVLLVEQRVEAVIRIADAVVFLEQGRVAEVTGPLTPDVPQFRRHVGI